MSNHSKGKRVLIISAVFPPEPVVSANISYDLAERLSFDNKVTVLSPKPSRPSGYRFENAEIQARNFEHQIQNSYICTESKITGRFKESYSFGRACYQYIREHKKEIDVIYVNTWPLAGQYWVVKAASKFKIPSVVHIQDVYPESLINKLPVFKSLLYSLLLPLDKYITRRCSKIVTISNGMRQLLAKTRGLPEDKLVVVYNWQDEKKYTVHEEKDFTSQPFTFMFLGSLSPSAAIDVAVQAFIRSGLKNSKLVIAGGGPEKEKLQSLAARSNDSVIEFIDAPAEMAGKLQSGSDVLLLTLKRGVARLALPSKLPAYMFSAKPVIGSVEKDSDTAQAIQESGCGWVVDPESIEQMSKAMVEAWHTDLIKRKTMGENGYLYATNHFSKQHNLPILAEIILNTAENEVS